MTLRVFAPVSVGLFRGKVAAYPSLSMTGATVTARDLEAALLTRCTTVARQTASIAQDQREANVFQIAAMVVQSRFPSESITLMQASERYFAAHPAERLAAGDVVRKGWVLSLPRLRNMLRHQLQGL